MQSPLNNTHTCSFSNEHCDKTGAASNGKERRRTHCINMAFGELRKCIPNVPTDTKLSKIKTLRLAISYIQYLTEMLDADEDNLYRARIIAYEIASKNDDNTVKRKKVVKNVSVLYYTKCSFQQQSVNKRQRKVYSPTRRPLS